MLRPSFFRQGITCKNPCSTRGYEPFTDRQIGGRTGAGQFAADAEDLQPRAMQGMSWPRKRWRSASAKRRRRRWSALERLARQQWCSANLWALI